MLFLIPENDKRHERLDLFFNDSIPSCGPVGHVIVRKYIKFQNKKRLLRCGDGGDSVGDGCCQQSWRFVVLIAIAILGIDVVVVVVVVAAVGVVTMPFAAQLTRIALA